MKKTIAIILARTGSSRLKNKTLWKPFNNSLTLINFFINRLKKCKKIDKIVLATTKKTKDKVLTKIAKKLKVDFYTGSEDDVLLRVVKTLNKYGEDFEYVLRANADCPLFMPTIQDKHIKNFIRSDKDLFSPFRNCIEPFGFSFCLFKKNIIFKINTMAKKKIYREHIENFCFDNKNKFSFFNPKKSKYVSPKLKLTLDNYYDQIKIRFLLRKLKKIPLTKQPSWIIKFFSN